MDNQQKTSIESSSIFTDFYNVITGARQSATQEFNQFWETIAPQPTTRRIAKPKKTPGIVYGRIIPDPNRRTTVKDVEIQTDSLSVKRRYSDIGESDRVPKLAKRDTTVPPVKSILKQPTASLSKNKHVAPKTHRSTHTTYHHHQANTGYNEVMTGRKSVQRIKFEIEEAFKPETPSLSLAYNEPVLPKRDHLKSVALSPSSSIAESSSSSSTYSYDYHSTENRGASGYVRSKINEIESSSFYHKTPERSPIRDNTMPYYHKTPEQSPLRDNIMPTWSFQPPIFTNPSLTRKYPKPTERHKANMKELIQHIPTYRLRRADTIIGSDGIERPNPIWNEIYNSRYHNL